MKKIISCVLICALLVLALVSCGKTKMRIDGMTFTFAYAEKSLEVVACSVRYADRLSNESGTPDHGCDEQHDHGFDFLSVHIITAPDYTTSLQKKQGRADLTRCGIINRK